MCIHETIQLSQDGERVIVCGDCGREFGRIARDPEETFIAYVFDDRPVVVLGQADETDEDQALVVSKNREVDELAELGPLVAAPVHPCRECGWHMSCHEEGEQCHT